MPRHKFIPAHSGQAHGKNPIPILRQIIVVIPVKPLSGETRIPLPSARKPISKNQKSIEAVPTTEEAEAFKTKSTISDDSGNFNSASSRQTELLEDEMHASGMVRTSIA